MVALRRCRGLDNVIYVACNAGAIQDNLLQLTLPMTDKRKAPEFTINNMTGFDLFPQTNHYEAFYVLKRIGWYYFVCIYQSNNISEQMGIVPPEVHNPPVQFTEKD